MKLSVIIVNYNVRHFLEQCLHSVFKAAQKVEAEVIVVDNNSVDGSCHMVKDKFPQVKLIENKENVGFSTANNQAITMACGEYILLLNPDTIVEEDTFRKALEFMDLHPDAGCTGVKMIDGKGRFLPESKRGLPTPWVAFYKIFGLSGIFPRSAKFGRYHLSYLDPDKTHEVDVLCGAFMLLRSEALTRTGLLDESFFMYGEDIDLSYRLQKAGYKNYYYPGTTIIHYKGESTRKGSINYVKVFYQAMLIFSRKHFSTGNFRLYSFFVHLAIYFRALIAIVQRLFSRIYLPLLDFAVIMAGFAAMVPLWERLMFEPGYYPDFFQQTIVPVYIAIWLAGAGISGGYRKPVNLFRLVRGLIWGTLAILVMYSLVDEDWRFSRALILMGAAWAIIFLPALRFIFNRMKLKGFELDIEKPKRIAIAGHADEVIRVKNLLYQTPVNPVIVGAISISEDETVDDFLGNIHQIREIIQVNRIDEIIFCAENLSSGEIIRTMLDLSKLDVAYKIAPPESYSIIGSNSIHTAGDLYLVNVNAISRKTNRRKKRLLDMLTATALFVSLPATWWFFRQKKQLLTNILQIILGKITWVGYISEEDGMGNLPALPPCVIDQSAIFQSDLSLRHKNQLNILYAKDYSAWNDLALIIKNFSKLDNQPHG